MTNAEKKAWLRRYDLEMGEREQERKLALHRAQVIRLTGPANFKKIIELKDDIVGAVEVPSLMERLGIKIKEAQQ